MDERGVEKLSRACSLVGRMSLLWDWVSPLPFQGDLGGCGRLGEAGLIHEVGFAVCQEAPASAFLSHEGLCHLARDGGGSCLPLGLSNGPTTQETVLRRD